jgi:hypothetical protein
MADAPADLEIRPLTADDDPAAQLDLAERAFGAIPAAQREQRLRSLPGHMASGRNLGAFAGRQPAASATFHDMRQWWCGGQVPQERDADIAHRSRWMLRVVDAPAAIAARGFPEAVSVRVVLRIDDRTRPANSGLWELAVSDGVGALAPFEPFLTCGALTLGARGVAALYAGPPVGRLRQAGLAGGGTPDGDAALDAAFAATAFMLDAF